MKKGGYQIIDLKNYNMLQDGTITVPGIYRLISNTNKPLLLTGITFNNTKQREQYVVAQKTGTQYVISFTALTGTVQLSIETNDMISITA